MDVALLTDSASCLPPGPQDGVPLHVLPLHVMVEGRRGDSREVTQAEVVDVLRAGRERVTTSRVSPGEFVTGYRALVAATGCRRVVSVHLSGRLSGTAEAAGLAAQELADEVEVRVVDARTVGLPLGWAALDAASLAREGGSLEEVERLARERASGARAWFYVDSLEHLRRGGRLGRAQAVLGSALAIKPLLGVDDGEVVLAERVRTRGRALARLGDLAAQAAERVREDGGRPRLGVHELGAEEAAGDLAAALARRVGVEPQMAPLDPGVGVHTGPGTLGVVVAHGG
ncbi:hypothetical protein BJF80_10075 [Serinicoccus sp. CUA-874]|uniref:DegV family protein n=1 Tax=Serinicoccus TaxID=265976 RepID=UPI000428645D|nr:MULTISPECIES: DegV family protein [Serinicoccus]OLT15229.1 hypothetical protein BJF80_10075 [Serinicoccus sp. CUA-874]